MVQPVLAAGPRDILGKQKFGKQNGLWPQWAFTNFMPQHKILDLLHFSGLEIQEILFGLYLGLVGMLPYQTCSKSYHT